ADWKSNFLGLDLEAYGHSELREVMTRELYVLQYHLYTVALARYLAFRLPEYEYNTHFGGVYYLFLRGMSPEHGSKYGVFFDQPSEALIRELSGCLHASTQRRQRTKVVLRIVLLVKQAEYDGEHEGEHLH